MPEKILYILGAGASVNALPLARSIWYEPSKIDDPRIRGLAYDLGNFDWTKLHDELDKKSRGFERP